VRTEQVTDAVMRRFERFMERLRAGDRASALEEFGRVGGLVRGSELELPDRLIDACVDAFIDLFRQAGSYNAMLRAAGEAQKALEADPEWSFARGEALFNLGRFEEARLALEPIAGGDFEDPMVYYFLACVAERRGEMKKAKALFGKANRLDPESCRLPVPVTEDEAIAVYNECLAELPDPIARFLRDVPIFVDALPSDELILMDDPPLDPLLMGLFLGQSAGEERSSWPDAQPRIVLFHRNIAKAGGDRDLLREELRTTLFHEVGHAIGFEEDGLEEMGL
jgi:predicted Zn-dependent protease with MMP-like domain